MGEIGKSGILEARRVRKSHLRFRRTAATDAFAAKRRIDDIQDERVVSRIESETFELIRLISYNNIIIIISI